MLKKLWFGAMVLMPTLLCANELAHGHLLLPMGPDMESRLRLPLQGVDPAQPVWVSYQMVALSADPNPTGSVALEGSLEGVQTPLGAMMASFTPRDMTISKGGGTITQQLQAGGRFRRHVSSPPRWC